MLYLLPNFEHDELKCILSHRRHLPSQGALPDFGYPAVDRKGRIPRLGAFVEKFWSSLLR